MNDRVLGEAMESLHGYNPAKKDTADAAHVHKCEWPSHVGKEDFGCKCKCGAVRHLIGWQEITIIAPTPVAPEPEEEHFEYRVVVPGGRGGRSEGYVYQGTDRATADQWVKTHSPKGAWLEKRAIDSWRRVG